MNNIIKRLIELLTSLGYDVYWDYANKLSENLIDFNLPDEKSMAYIAVDIDGDELFFQYVPDCSTIKSEQYKLELNLRLSHPEAETVLLKLIKAVI